MKLKTGMRSGSQAGLGDCVEKIAAALGIDRAAAKYEQVSGKSCGCAKRKEMLNNLVPKVI